MRIAISGVEYRKMADSLTDEQLVDELESYGETVSLPIKPNKRPILVKKLNHLRSRNRHPSVKGKGRQTVQRREPNLSSFSSDDSDTEPVSTSGPSFNQSNRRSLEPSASSKITEVVKRSLRHRPNVSSLSVTVRGRQTPTVDQRSPDRPGSAPIPSHSQRRSRRNETPEPDQLPDVSNHRSVRLYPNISAVNQDTASFDHSVSDRSIIQFDSSDSDIGDTSSYEVENKSVNTSFGLLRGRHTPPSNHVSPNRHSYSTRSSPETNHTVSPSRYSTSSKGRTRRRLYPEHVSFGLVTLVLAFFVVIFFGYILVRKELLMGWLFSDSAAQGDNKNFLLCTEKAGSQESGNQNCYNEAEKRKATIVIQDLFDDLSARKGKVVCGEAPESEQRMSKESFIVDLKQRGLSEHMELERMFNYTLYLIIRNPEWNLRALTKNGDMAEKTEDVLYLESTVAFMSFVCRLRRSFSRVIWSLFVLVVGVTSLVMVLLLLWWRIQAKEREEQKVFAMVEQIIDLLKEQHEFVQNEDTTEQSGLAVQHVRDQLLPPSIRKAQQHIWDQAVKFIEANESRVRLETQVIEGEEFDVWRWIQTVPNGGKVWQGQAFGEHNDSNASTAIYSPTPCLKIRNMFDKEVESAEDWEENVKDALLEKCQDIRSLIHIYVDKNSREGCVYVKCNSKEAAGRVRQALHGWWFDGRLVTVKHLKLDHYHNRWPEAKFAWRPLQPSTNQMRSLAQPYHRSSLEMT